MMPTYIGVGLDRMCAECGVGVLNTTRHDKFHAAIIAELDKLRRENLELSLKLENLARSLQLVGV